MAYHSRRESSYSNLSYTTRTDPSSSAQTSTQTLLNSLHNSYVASKPLALESSSSLVVNTWVDASQEDPNGRAGGTVDPDLARRAWEHARRRAEDGCIVLGTTHESTPSLLVPFISALPITMPEVVYTAIAAVRPFLTCVTPQNPFTCRGSALAASFTLSLAGSLTAATLRLSTSGIDTSAGLLDLPAQQGFRAFNVFYCLLSSASTHSEREYLGLRSPSSYALLKKSETYETPSYLPTADDAAAAEELKDNLRAIGVSGSARRDLISILAALLKLGDTVGYFIEEDDLEMVVEEAAGLLDLDPEVLLRQCSTEDRRTLIAGVYEALVDWVISKANQAIALELRGQRQISSGSSSSEAGAMTPTSEEDDTACITVLELSDPNLGKAATLSTVFNDAEGINAEMKQDGVPLPPVPHSVLTEMRSAISAKQTDLGITSGQAARDKDLERDRREAVLEKVSHEAEEDSFLKSLLSQAGGYHSFGHSSGRFELMNLIGSNRVWFQLCLHPSDDLPVTIATLSTPWSAASPSRQLRSWRLPDWANRRNKQLDYTADFDLDEFSSRYARLGCKEGRDGIESFLLERGWSNGEVIIGTERVWVREGSWWEAESMLDMLPADHTPGHGLFHSPFGDSNANLPNSQDDLLQGNPGSMMLDSRSIGGVRSLAPTAAMTVQTAAGGDYGLGFKGDESKGAAAYVNDLDPELADPQHVEEQSNTRTRRMWLAFVWALTFWIPSFILRHFGRMKRPDVRMAWREKVVLVALILLLNAIVVFYIIAFGTILCPNQDKAWNTQQLSTHQGTDDFYVAVRGRVYDISKFVKTSHGTTGAMATNDLMTPYAGLVLDQLFPIPLNVACPTLVTDPNMRPLQVNQTALNPNIIAAPPQQHLSGRSAPFRGSSLKDPFWFRTRFQPTMKQYYKGELVYGKKEFKYAADVTNKPIVHIDNNVYDLSDYFYNKATLENFPGVSFLAPQVEDMIQQNPGTDITDEWNKFKAANATGAQLNFICLTNAFYVGKTDFRETARCQVNNYILLAFTIILCMVILTKFLSALQLSSKKRPAQQDKFVICQVPAYTEGEDHLRKGLDSLTALAYDNKRKLLFVICDGMIVGGGNDRPTPKIVLDILGVDPKVDPPALPFKSVGSGSEKLNYGKVYSGLYEYEGNVVPYVVVVKVGKESEQTKAKPGNRGKRDSQIMLMNFLNRVHHRAPMSPLELEMFHQINNIIGVDPELYEYLFMVDADTLVAPDSLNRLVAQCANDAKIAGICGETSLENEERSWTTMIQVYEYYISHHLAKAFESLFGSVTCLPGCFCMYRLRTADKGKPLIISDKVIKDYSIQDVDTLHKKNLLSLGEDRYLTTLMTKYFPSMSYKFESGAYAKTAAPESWSVLLSQRRRWINSTIHNLAELVFLKDLCGFCCFSMRFVVFIDLFGTIILPATCAYIVYLVYRVASHNGSLPLISIIMLGAVYGLQAIIFLIKRQWQHIGWMLIYILAFPIYSLILPLYSFWKQDDFSWGNTRIVIGEKGHKKVVATEDEGFDPRSIPLQGWDEYATVNNLPGRRGNGDVGGSEKAYDDNGYEMDDIRSMYSSATKPASTVLTGFKSGHQFYMPPQSPAAFGQSPMQQRQSNLSRMSGHYQDSPSPMGPATGGTYSGGNTTPRVMSEYGFPRTDSSGQYMQGTQSPAPGYQSTDNLMMMGSGLNSQPITPHTSMPLNRAGRASPMPFAQTPNSRTASTANLNFVAAQSGLAEPSDANIIEAIQACLQSVDLDNVTKKQLKVLTEQRLHCQLGLEKRAFMDQRIDEELANM